MDESKTKELLKEYRTVVEQIKEDLRAAGMSENQIILHTINLPEFERMIPEDTIKLFRDIKKLLIIHLDELGLSTRQIAKRLGGNSHNYVKKILDEHYKEQEDVTKVNVEEVSNS